MCCSGAKDGIDFSGFSLLLGKWGNQAGHLPPQGFHKLDDVVSGEAAARVAPRAVQGDQAR